MTARPPSDPPSSGEITPPSGALHETAAPPQGLAEHWDPAVSGPDLRTRPPQTVGLLAIVSGTAALLLGLVPDAGVYLSGACAVVTIVLGVIGFLTSRKALAVIGVVLAAGGLALSLGIRDAESEETGGAEVDAFTEAYGEAIDSPPVVDGAFEFTVSLMRQGLDEVGTEERLKARPEGEFVVFDLTVRNIGEEPALFSDSQQRLHDTEGNEYSGDSSAAFYLAGNDFWLTAINPGEEIQGQLVFDVPVDTELAALTLHQSADTAGAEVVLS